MGAQLAQEKRVIVGALYGGLTITRSHSHQTKVGSDPKNVAARALRAAILGSDYAFPPRNANRNAVMHRVVLKFA